MLLVNYQIIKKKLQFKNYFVKLAQIINENIYKEL